MTVSPTAIHEHARHPETAASGPPRTPATGYWLAGAIAGLGVAVALA